MSLPSQVNIINLALGHLKNRPISSISESSVQALAANNCYEISRREALRSHQWEFATAIIPLALSATYETAADWAAGEAYVVGNVVIYNTLYYRCNTAHTSSAAFSTDEANWSDGSSYYSGKWLYAYSYPSNCVALWSVYNEGTINKKKGEQYRVVYDTVNAGKVILTDCSEAMGEYTYDLEDTTLFSADFITAFAYRLAADMAPALTGDDSIANDMLKKFMLAISEAKRISAYENTSRDTQTSSYEEAR
jgi:hypothetical protein